MNIKTLLSAVALSTLMFTATVQGNVQEAKDNAYQLAENVNGVDVLIPIGADMELKDSEYQHCFIMTSDDGTMDSMIYVSDANNEDSYIIPTDFFFDVSEEDKEDMLTFKDVGCE